MAQGTFVQALRKEAALSGTFMKGRSLVLNGAVLSIEDSGSRFSKNVTVEGSVRGSRGDLYKTRVALDMDEHEVIDYDCDCPAAYRYPGMCKHAIATALAYLDASGVEPVEGLRTPVRTFTAQPKQPARTAPKAPAVNPNFPFPAPVPTSPSLMAALSDLSDARMDELASMRRKLAGAVDPDAPKAALEPSLVPYYNPLFADRFSWALEFRIRCGSVSYVVKDIDGMADAYVRGGTFSYGKKLTFVHTPEAFEDVSTKLLNLVVTTVAYLDDITSSRSASYDFARSGFVAERQLPLSEHSIVYVLDLLRGQTISFEPAWSRGTTTHRTYDVAVEPAPQGKDEAPTKRPPLLASKIAPAAAATTFACPPICTALHRAMLPTWSTRAARAVPTRRLPNMRRRSYRACCPVARRSISLPTRWGSSVVWRCPFCATIPTLPRPPCSIPWHPSRALLWRSASTMGS